MRVLMRKQLDYSKPINLRRLKPKEKIVAGFMSFYLNTNYYIEKERQKDSQEYKRLLKKDDTFKNYLISQIQRELVQNKSLSGKGKSCNIVYIEVSSEYFDSVYRLLGIKEDGTIDNKIKPNKDFNAFSIERVKEHEDLRRAFKNMPFMLTCKKRVIGE